MAKYEIEFHDADERNIPITYANGFLYLIGGFRIKAKPISEPSYSRQTVLQELWKPTGNYIEKLQIIKDDEFGIRIEEYTGHIFSNNSFVKDYVCAPNKSLAEEIVQIREGKWLPKIGDNACGYSSKTGRSSSFLTEIENDFSEEKRPNDSVHYFPSKKQRTAFIEKNKPKEEKPEWWINGETKIKIFGRDVYVENGFLKVR